MPSIPQLRCDLCVRAGRQRNLHATYEVLGVRACRIHIAKVIDAAKNASAETELDVRVDVVTSLAQVRNHRRHSLKHELFRALETIGILEIPDPNID